MSKQTQKAIYEILSTDANVTTELGSPPNDKIYPTFVPEDVNFPALIYRITNKEPLDTKDGVYGSVDTLMIELYHDKAAKTVEIADVVRTALDRYRGTIESVIIDRIIFETESDEELVPDLFLFHLSQQYRVRVKY